MRLLTSLLLLLPAVAPVSAQETAPAELARHLPRDCGLYVEASQPHDLARSLRSSPALAPLHASLPADAKKLLDAVRKTPIARLAIGVRTPGFLRSPRWYLLLDGVRDQDAVRDTLADLGIPEEQIGQRGPATWVVASDGDALEAMPKIGRSLAAQEEFAWYRDQIGSGDVTFYANLRRVAPIRPGLLKPDETGATFFLGHVLATAAKAPAIAGRLSLDDGLGVTLRTRSLEFPATHRFLVPEHAETPILTLPGGIARLSLTRDVPAFWENRADLGKDADEAAFAKARSDIQTLLGDLAFEELMAAIGPTFDVYAAPLPDDVGTRIRYPMGALVTPLRGDTLAEDLVLSFQSIIGIQNIQRGTMGEPRFLLESALHRGVPLYTARHFGRHLPSSDDPRHQLRMTLAITKGQLIFGSHPRIVRDLVDSLVDQRVTARAANDDLWLDGEGVRRLVADNLDTLAAQRVLEEGGTLEEARRDITTALELTKSIRSLDLDLTFDAAKHAIDLLVDAPGLLRRKEPR